MKVSQFPNARWVRVLKESKTTVQGEPFMLPGDSTVIPGSSSQQPGQASEAERAPAVSEIVLPIVALQARIAGRTTGIYPHGTGIARELGFSKHLPSAHSKQRRVALVSPSTRTCRKSCSTRTAPWSTREAEPSCGLSEGIFGLVFINFMISGCMRNPIPIYIYNIKMC